MVDNQDTIAAIATPPGRGGIGIVRMSGPDSLLIAKSITGESLLPRHATFCHFSDSAGESFDYGIAIYFPAPASFTGEDVVELHGHGGQVIIDQLLGQALNKGARLARAGEFTERAFHNNKIDLLQAEAVADLIDSSSSEAARSAMRSLSGEFSEKIFSLLQYLREIRVFVEGALDFPEEEIDFLSGSDIRDRLQKCIGQVKTILLQTAQGQVLREGINVAIIGPPNAGKSSLMNSLSRKEKAIVTSIPGTTRDLLEDRILIDGIPVTVIDTAGIRETKNSIEKEGIRRAKAAAEKADIVLLVREAHRDNQDHYCSISEELTEEKNCIVLFNKIDLLNIAPRSEEKSKSRVQIYISVKTGEGMELLKFHVKKMTGIAEQGEPVLSGRSRHIDALQSALTHLEQAEKQFQAGKPAAELVAEDLHQAQHWLESITGRSTADDLLGEIFSQFCIGK